MPRGIRLPCAKQDGKNGEGKCRQQDGLVRRRIRRPVGAIGQRLETHADRFQLQRDIGQAPCHSREGCGGRNRPALAVARRQEVRQGRDAFALGDIPNPLHEARKQDEHQRRSQINGQVIPSAFHRCANGAEERPGCAIHCQRERIDQRVLGESRPHCRLVPAPGDQEQAKHVERGRSKDQPDRHLHLSIRFMPELHTASNREIGLTSIRQQPLKRKKGGPRRGHPSVWSRRERLFGRHRGHAFIRNAVRLPCARHADVFYQILDILRRRSGHEGHHDAYSQRQEHEQEADAFR